MPENEYEDPGSIPQNTEDNTLQDTKEDIKIQNAEVSPDADDAEENENNTAETGSAAINDSAETLNSEQDPKNTVQESAEDAPISETDAVTDEKNNSENIEKTENQTVSDNSVYDASEDPIFRKRELTPEEAERINKYQKFKKVNGETYKRVNTFLRRYTYITAREWAIARLCADFTTRSGAEMTFIGANLPELVPFMTDTYSPQAVNQARASFKRKVKKSAASFFYGALCGFFTADELDDILFEASEVAGLLLEIENTSVDVDDEIQAEDRIAEVMRTVAGAASRIKAPKMVSDEDDDADSDDFSDDDISPENLEFVRRKDHITEEERNEYIDKYENQNISENIDSTGISENTEDKE